MADRRFPMADDRVIGDGGNLTIYERPDKSRYALDKRGAGHECGPEVLIFGRARFDARARSSGTWAGSRSELQVIPADESTSAVHQVRRRGWSKA